MAEKTNISIIFSLIQSMPDGIDDDELSRLSGITPRQQVAPLCRQLEAVGKIERRSTPKDGKRKKIHNGG